MSKKKVAAEKEAEEAAAASLGERDVVLGEGADASNQKTNLLLQDMIRLQRVLWKLQGKSPPEKEDDLDDITEHFIGILKNGKSYELAGLGWGVPKPFLKSSGRIMAKDGDGWKELSEEDAKLTLRKTIFEQFNEDDLGDLSDSCYKELKTMLDRKSDEIVTDETPVLPAAKDAILLRCDEPVGEKVEEQQGGNKVIFSLASQLVTIFTNNPEKRLEAALLIMNGLEEAEIPSDDDKKGPPPKYPRYMVRRLTTQKDDLVFWTALSVAEAAEFVLTFVFEVFLEKEIHLMPLPPNEIAYTAQNDTAKPSTEPIKDPSDHDVLFGRGGMTNSHPGNRRFRDVIALHRPDYIRAIKMDKPGVAKKIVKAIRMGTPQGRFLKKKEDGMWYDVGDRNAAEKTSQALRERSNAEKRQRSALREALRIRKQDMAEDVDILPAPKKAKGSGSASASGSTSGKETDLAGLSETLNYVGTNLPVPLSLNMGQPAATNGGKKKSDGKGKSSAAATLATEGLPPNAVDSEGNILVTDYDILCGRGGLTNHHKGNKRFRDIVALHRPDYVRAPKIQKPSVARVIVRAIRNGDPPGRFLRKDEKSGKWVDIGDKKAAEKTSQALREKSNEERDKLKREPGNIGVLLPNPASYLAAATANAMGNLLAGGTGTDTEKEAEQADDKEKDTKEEDKKPEAEEKEDDEEAIQTVVV